MADNLLDLYLGSGKIEPEKEQSSSLIDTYLGTASSTIATPPGIPRITVTPRVPISDNPVEQQKFEQSLANRPLEKSIISKALALPVEAASNYGQDVYRHASNAGQMFSEGANEISSNKPLGIGKMVLGAAGVPLSLVTAPLEEAVNFGNKILPKATPGLPTDLAGNPISDKPFNMASPTEVALGALPVSKIGSVIKATMPSSKAITAIIDTIGKDNLPSVIQELKSNPRNSLMDVVPATRQMAQKLITTEGQHQNKFEKFVTDRVASGKGATTDIYDTTMGTPVNVVDKINTLKQAAKDVGSKEINPAVKGSGFVDVSNVINKLDAKLKPGVNSIITAGEPLALGDIEKPLAAVRKFIMDEKSVRTDPQSLHQFQSALRAKADDLLNSQNGQDRQIGHALMSVRNDIVEAIDKVSPRIANTPDKILKHYGYDEAAISGMDAAVKKKTASMLETAKGKVPEEGSYKAALSSYRDEKQVENAFNMGQLVTRNKLGRLEDSPEFWNNWVKGATKEELEAAREGARLAVQHQIAGFKAGARKGQDIVESEFNKDKLSSLFGKEEVDKMAKLLKDERNIAITNSKLIDNSQTAMRMKADARVDLPTKKESSLLPLIAGGAEVLGSSQGLPGIGAGLVIGSNLANKARFNYATLPLAKARNERITDLLTATGEKRDELIRILESHLPQPKQSMLQRTRNLALPVLPP